MAGHQFHRSTGYGPRTRLYFDGRSEQYTIWETRFINYLYTLDKGVHKAILPQGDDEDDDFDSKNKWAYAELVQVLDERSLQLIINDAPDNGRLALHVLRQHFASTEKPRILQLYEKLTTLRMSVDEDVTDYLIRAEKASTGLNAAGENITDNLVIAMLLKGLPEEYKPFVVVHTQMDKTKTLTEFKAALRTYANTEASRSSVQHTAMTAKKYDNTTSRHTTQCLSCGKHGHNSRNCRNKAKLHCTYCNRQGHVENVCFTKKRNSNANNTNAKATTVREHASATFTMTVNEQSVNKQNEHNDCYLLVDCGATCHIINNPNLFISHDDTFQPEHHYIELADGRRSNELAVARGNAKLLFTDSKGNTANVVLKDALLAPKFPTSLFSVRAATDAGAKVVFSKGAAELIVQDMHFKLTRRGRLYFLPTDAMTYVQTARTLDTWHRTLGHMNYDDILRLQSVTDGMIVTQKNRERTGTTCAENKLTKTPKSLDEAPSRATKLLQRVHTDICGPVEPSLREGYRYVINFVDEYSSILFVYFLRSEDEVSQALKTFLADVAPYERPKR